MNKHKEIMKYLEITEEDFEEKETTTTIEDIVEALDILASIVLGEEE